MERIHVGGGQHIQGWVDVTLRGIGFLIQDGDDPGEGRCSKRSTAGWVEISVFISEAACAIRCRRIDRRRS